MRDHLLHQWHELVWRRVGEAYEPIIQRRTHAWSIELLDQRFEEREFRGLCADDNAARAWFGHHCHLRLRRRARRLRLRLLWLLLLRLAVLANGLIGPE